MLTYSAIKITYFSGTGGTAMVAQNFMNTLKARGCLCTIERIPYGKSCNQSEHDLLFLLFPVHAFNAPEPIYEWIERQPAVNGTSAAVISISGGGEVSPNTACRISTINRLSKKGYHIIYDTMIVMPSNFIIPTIEPLAIALLQVLPDKVNRIADDILSGKHEKSSPLFQDRLLSVLGELEKHAGRFWGRFIKTNDSCTGCGCCVKNCPSGNITILGGKPHFSNKCNLCLKCIYDCRRKALAPGILKFIVIKDGYDLNALSEKTQLFEIEDVHHLAKGVLWSGVKKYLSE